MAISTYSELQTAVGEWLNRTDLAAASKDFIALAEAKFKRDIRLRKLVAQNINVVADDHALPSTYRELVSLYHDGPTYYGPLTIVSPGQLSNHKQRTGDIGVPSHAAIIGVAGAPTLRFAPEPDSGGYDMKIVYSAVVPSLSDSLPSNWLLEDHPDIYLYGALVEAEPFLQEDERIQIWLGMLGGSLQQFYLNQQRMEFGGNLSRFPANAIGSKV